MPSSINFQVRMSANVLARRVCSICSNPLLLYTQHRFAGGLSWNVDLDPIRSIFILDPGTVSCSIIGIILRENSTFLLY